MTREKLELNRQPSILIIRHIGRAIIAANRWYHQDTAPVIPREPLVAPIVPTIAGVTETIGASEIRCEECPKTNQNRTEHPAQQDVECPFYEYPPTAVEPECVQGREDNSRLN